MGEYDNFIVDGGIEDSCFGNDFGADGDGFSIILDGVSHHEYLLFGKAILAGFSGIVHVVFNHIGIIFGGVFAGIGGECAVEVGSCGLLGGIVDEVGGEAIGTIAPYMSESEVVPHFVYRASAFVGIGECSGSSGIVSSDDFVVNNHALFVIGHPEAG